jgi:hypothetical protein
VSRLFVQTYEAETLAGLQAKLLDSLTRAQEQYAIQELQVSHAHHSYFDEAQDIRCHQFSALLVLRVP